jgi:N-acetylmuramoyl-L-alanine amidase
LKKTTVLIIGLVLLRTVNLLGQSTITAIDDKGKTSVVSTLLFDREEYLPVADLMEPWSGQVDWIVQEGRADIKLPGHTLRLSGDNTFFLLDGKSYNLYNPVRIYDSELWVPMELFTRFLIPLWGKGVGWDPKGRKLSLGMLDPREVSIPQNRPRLQSEQIRAIEKVVIDAGHGGKDPGAVGPGRLQEKDMNLDIAFRLKTILEDQYGVRVVMTRDQDVFIPLGDRTAIANREAADIFISIHCNAAPKKKRNRSNMRGVETYFLSLAKTDDARATAAMENSAIQFEQPDKKNANFDDIQLILWDVMQNEFLKESSDLAEWIQEELAEGLSVPNRGVNQAGFYVLNGAYMPAVLVETSFISHPEEERLLKKTSFRQSVAEGIARGLKEFARRYKCKLGKN